MAFLMQQLFDDLQDLLMTVHVWQQDKSALRQLANIDIEKYSFHFELSAPKDYLSKYRTRTRLHKE